MQRTACSFDCRQAGAGGHSSLLTQRFLYRSTSLVWFLESGIDWVGWRDEHLKSVLCLTNWSWLVGVTSTKQHFRIKGVSALGDSNRPREHGRFEPPVLRLLLLLLIIILIILIIIIIMASL